MPTKSKQTEPEEVVITTTAKQHQQQKYMMVAGAGSVFAASKIEASIRNLDVTDEIIASRIKKGKCPQCGIVETHKRRMLGLQRDTRVGQVYKGICLQCNTLYQAKLKLGEPVDFHLDRSSTESWQPRGPGKRVADESTPLLGGAPNDGEPVHKKGPPSKFVASKDEEEASKEEVEVNTMARPTSFHWISDKLASMKSASLVEEAGGDKGKEMLGRGIMIDILKEQQKHLLACIHFNAWVNVLTVISVINTLSFVGLAVLLKQRWPLTIIFLLPVFLIIKLYDYNGKAMAFDSASLALGKIYNIALLKAREERANIYGTNVSGGKDETDGVGKDEETEPQPEPNLQTSTIENDACSFVQCLDDIDQQFEQAIESCPTQVPVKITAAFELLGEECKSYGNECRFEWEKAYPSLYRQLTATIISQPFWPYFYPNPKRVVDITMEKFEIIEERSVAEESDEFAEEKDEEVGDNKKNYDVGFGGAANGKNDDDEIEEVDMYCPAAPNSQPHSGNIHNNEMNNRGGTQLSYDDLAKRFASLKNNQAMSDDAMILDRIMGTKTGSIADKSSDIDKTTSSKAFDHASTSPKTQRSKAMKAAGMNVSSGGGKKPVHVYGKKKGSSDEDNNDKGEARKEAGAEVPHISLMEVRQGGKPSVRGTGSGQRARDSANTTQGHGQGGQAPGDDPDDGFKDGRDKPFTNRIRYLFGWNCQSTVWNRTGSDVCVIITDTFSKKIRTTNRNVEVNPTFSSVSVGQAGIASTTSAEEVPNLTIVPICSGNYHTFNLNGSDYYLSFYTQEPAGSDPIVHQYGVKVRGKRDYWIRQEYLRTRVELSKIDNALGMKIFGSNWRPNPPTGQ